MEIAAAVSYGVGSVFNFIGSTPRRIARQKDAARGDALTPGMFNQADKSTTYFIIITLVLALLIIGMIVYAAAKK